MKIREWIAEKILGVEVRPIVISPESTPPPVEPVRSGPICYIIQRVRPNHREDYYIFDSKAKAEAFHRQCVLDWAYNPSTTGYRQQIIESTYPVRINVPHTVTKTEEKPRLAEVISIDDE